MSAEYRAMWGLPALPQFKATGRKFVKMHEALMKKCRWFLSSLVICLGNAFNGRRVVGRNI